MTQTIYGKILKQGYFTEYLKDTVVFNIDEIARYYWESEKTDWNVMNDDFPNIAPPYENYFMQYNMPRGEIIVQEGVMTVDYVEQYGFHFRSKKLDWDKHNLWFLDNEPIDPSIKWLVTFNLYTYSEQVSTMVYRDDTTCTYGVDERGQIKPIWGDKTKPMLITFAPAIKEVMYDLEKRQDLLDAIFGVLHPCLLATTFLHTKNTVIHSNKEIDAAKSKSAKRHMGKKRDEPYYEYHVLDIRPLREVLRREGVEGKSGIAKAAHLRRGHFADYSEGRGLFGKHKGLYWFDSTFVGNKKTGTVKKDYEIHTPVAGNDEKDTA